MALQFVSIDAALSQGPEADAYLFAEDLYLAFDWMTYQVKSGYPQTLAQGWPNLPEAGDFASGHFDGACFSPSTGYCYFFKGGQVLAYNPSTKQPLPGYPKPLAQAFPGLPPVAHDGVDAVLGLPQQDLAYLFKGAAFVAVNLSNNQLLDGYPLAASDAWPGWPQQTLFGSGIDAGFCDASKKQIVFFKGSDYLLFDQASNQIASGYPKPIGAGWGNWPVAMQPLPFNLFQQLGSQAQVEIVGEYLQLAVLDTVLQQIADNADYVKLVTRIADAIKAEAAATAAAWQSQQATQTQTVPASPDTSNSSPKPKAFSSEWTEIASTVSGFKPGVPIPGQSPSLAELLNQIARAGGDYAALAQAYASATDSSAQQNVATALVQQLRSVQALQSQALPCITIQLEANATMEQMGQLNSNRSIEPSVLTAADKVLLQLQNNIPSLVGQMYADCLANGLVTAA